MPEATDLFVFFAWILGGFVSGVSGIGGAMVAFPFLAMLLPVHEAIALTCIVNMVMDICLASLHFRFCRVSALWPMLLASVPGSFAGLYILQICSGPVLQGAVGLLLLYYVYWQKTFRARGTIAHPRALGAVAGFGSGLLGTAIAVYAAWRSYQPIRKLYAKYGGSQKPSNELQTLEDLLSNSLKRNSFSQKQIEEQMEQLDLQQSWLKQQLVMMLITGNDSPVVKELIQKMGFEMSHAHFALCFLYLQGDEGDRTGLVRSIEDFSDEECTLYAAELQENREYIVLMNFQEEEQCRELLELLSDSLESRNLSVRVQWSRTCSQLNEIASAAIETLNTPPVALAVDNAEAEEEDALEQMAALTESGSTSQALALLETMIAQTENRYPSYLMRIYMLNRLVQQMMTLASREGVTLPPKSPGQDPDSVRETLEQLVRALCRKGAQRSSAEKPEGGKTAAYVREHCLDGDISLSSTAEALGISTKQVSRLLRMEVNMTFKEYLLHLRMSAAQDFLREEGLSIAETAGRVGYFNISHFIKCFKAYTGMTPGEWKKLSSGRTME